MSTIWSWPMVLTARASLKKRSRSWGRCAISGWMVLIATLRPITVAGCGSSTAAQPEAAPADGPPAVPGGPLARPILFFDPSAAAENQAKLPAGFQTPLDSACSTDPTRAFLGELFDHGIGDIRV